MCSVQFLHPLFSSCTKTSPFAKDACHRPLPHCCFYWLKKSKSTDAPNCGFCIDEPRKKRYTIFWRCSRAARCRGVAQLVARLLWEQEAASSSLATPILQTHVDSVRISVRFCFACETAGKNPNVCKNCAHCKTVFQKQSSLFSISSPFAGLIKAHKCGILNSTLFERSKEV